MKSHEFNQLTSGLGHSPKMPVLFVGHGSPMIAIEENEFVSEFRRLGDAMEKPNAIVCVSAHWETKGSQVTAMEKPQTIHDFGGFPKELFAVQYPAPGSPELAQEVRQMVTKSEVGLDYNWGLDHGTWSIVKHMYPEADVPVIQLSIDHTKDAQYHFDLAKELAALRHKGVLIVGSGNIVHNLRTLDWYKINSEFAYDWAEETNEKTKKFILSGDLQSLVNYRKQGSAFEMSIPTPEHYIPLIYAMALKESNDDISIFNDKTVAGSLSMTSVRIG
ncbi:4,5-DOPA dioxygenase extradiol [Paludibacter sp.]|uniref:4,5-DOPA-extradiol-dioxygenase n=1 Tax=Paludibacter sp. TaxID=1898105 RepID=UPI0013555923|nr:4,5-DOPA dioxygenase extradiol [Paludibacter sp.]MTK52772.1 4,5-DOPA dioxygenase extradiol [Paludibacter sp.]